MTQCDVGKIDNEYDLKRCLDKEYAELLSLTDYISPADRKKLMRQAYKALSAIKARFKKPMECSG